MSENTATQISFWQLLKEKKIEIPIIQRDYAQGREESPENEKYDIKEIRESFLEYLFSCLTNTNVFTIELDFIYGNEKEETENSVYQLLDGQQRLTTLFLLHWYAANRENTLKDNVEILKRFTYETRTSSREFCEKLVTYGIDFEKLISVDKSEESSNKQLSAAIKDTFWFFKVWGKDPTVSAMLNMLDSIHCHVKDKNIIDIWEKLTVENRITFINFPLKNFGLSDDLYIKMNARGKQLTGFENFKAEMQKKIKEERWENDIDPRETFSFKSDTTWMDLFWAYKNKENKIDSAFLQVIVFSMLGRVALRLGVKEAKKIQKIYNTKHIIEYTVKDDIDYLKKAFDFYYEDGNDKIPINISFWGDLDIEDETANNFFVTLVKTKPSSLSYRKLVLYYAQTEYLVRFGAKNKEALNDWMRVVRNIVQNQDVDDVVPYISALQLVTELLDGAGDIYSYLAASPKMKSRFSSGQMEEEVFKAQLIVKSYQNKKAIFKTEDINFCKGRIGFAFYCIDCENDINAFKADKLLEIQGVIKDNLDDEDISNDFRRALFTVGDNKFYEYWWSWLHAANAVKRCLVSDISDLQHSFAYAKDDRFRNYLKNLLNQLTKVKLVDMIKNYSPPKTMPHWEKRLIEEDGLLEDSKKHYIAIAQDDSCCWLIPGTKVANTDEGKKRLTKIS